MSGGHWGLGYLAGIPFRRSWSRKRMRRLQDKRLRWLLKHTDKTITFYRELLRESGVSVKDITGLDELEKLPRLSKQDLREAGNAAWSDDVPASRRIMASTSGSSDQPLTLAYRFSDRLRKHVIGLDCMFGYGWRPWYRGLALGSEALPVNHGLEKFGISRWHWVDPTRPVADWLDDYHQVRPQAFHSYPSALREFCFEALANGPLKWQPKVLSVGGEFYPQELTPLVTEVFGRPPLVMYGAVEGGRLAFECEAHQGLHVRPDAVHIELLSEGRPVEPGEDGSVHITSLINTVMPIIRYELGDIASWVPGECPCGLWWPRLKMHQGRKGDVVPLPGGRRIPVTRLAAIVGKSRAIRQFQFLRASDEVLVLRYEASGQDPESLEPVMVALREALHGLTVEAQAGGPLPRTRSGKVTRYVDERKRDGSA